MSRVALIVIHFGESEPTRRCVRAARTAAGDRRIDILVVDNSPSSALDERGVGAPVLHCPDNPGYGAGANRGARLLASRGWEHLVVLNNDVEILPGFVVAAERALAGEDVGAAGGPIRLDHGHGALWYAGGDLRRLTGTVVQRRSEEDARSARDIEFIPGAAIAVVREAWEEVSGFDSRFFLYHEDLDLCRRLRRAGWRLRFEPAMEAVHHLGGATGSGNRSPLYLEELTATRFKPHRSHLYRLYLASLHGPYVLLRALHALVAEGGRAGRARAGALLTGYWRAIRDIFD